MSITFHKEEVNVSLDETSVSSWIILCIKKLKIIHGDISIILCDDDYLKGINLEYLNHNYYTDIITFDYSEKDKISGDLFISIERVKENAEINNVDFINELCRVIIHGVLHLCGFNDKTEEEKKEIRHKENYFLSLIS